MMLWCCGVPDFMLVQPPAKVIALGSTDCGRTAGTLRFRRDGIWASGAVDTCCFVFFFWDQSMRDTWRFRHVSKATHVDSSATGGASRGHLYVSGYSFWTPCDMWLQEAKSISVTRVNFWATIYHQYREETPNSSSRPKRLLRGLPFLITSIFKSIEILERKAGCLTTLVHLDQRWRPYQKF